MRLLAILLVAGCGRIRFDGGADADEYPDLVDGIAGGTLVDATGHGHLPQHVPDRSRFDDASCVRRDRPS